MSDVGGTVLQLVSEVAGVDHSDPVKVTDWAHVDWVRPTVEDPGSKFYGTIHVPEGFGKPGLACRSDDLRARSGHACQRSLSPGLGHHRQ